MPVKIQAIRGMNDILPSQTGFWQLVEDACRQVAKSYAYQEIRFPIMEQTHLFQRTIGDSTDIVEKEMYTFTDRNGESISLRPEGTAGCIRAGLEQGLFHNQIQRLWYLGPMFRHERPQKGRYRQFHQFGAEAIGMAGPDLDAELILLAWRLWGKLGLRSHTTLQINTLGRSECRLQYRERLVHFYKQHYQDLDEDSQRRLLTNPLRILDSKNPQMIALNQQAPTLIEHLDPPSLHHFQLLCELLDAAKIPYEVNPRLVRGLDYYEHTVFEWVNDQLGSQNTMCAGGRYDGLIEQLGGNPTPAAGFAIGLERLVLILSQLQTVSERPFVYMVLSGDAAIKQGLLLSETLRNELPHLSIQTNLSGGSFKSQMKRADKSGAQWAVIIGDHEVVAQTVTVKELRESGQQQTIPISQLNYFLRAEEI